MKKILLFAATAAILSSCGNKNQYTIEGEIGGGTNNTVYLFSEKEELLDSAVIKNGAFRLKGTTEEPKVAVLRDARGQGATFGAMLILEPGKITVANNEQSPFRKKVTGTPANDANEAYTTATTAFIQELRKQETTPERREAIQKEHETLSRTTMEQNRNNLFGALLLAQQIGYELSGQELLDEIAKFTPEMQQTQVLTKLAESAKQKIKSDVGQPFIEVTAPDAEGKEITLSSVVKDNKYVLLDFWASWCGPCMGEVPFLKQAYDQFHKKGFEIYGVSFDDSREEWLKAVKEKEMGWIHVSELKGFDNAAAKEYAVQGIPTNFLIDNEGNIVAKNLRGEALCSKIEELLAQ